MFNLLYDNIEWVYIYLVCNGIVLETVIIVFYVRKQIFKDDNDFAWRLLEA